MKLRSLGLLVLLATAAACRGTRISPAEPRTEPPSPPMVRRAPVGAPIYIGPAPAYLTCPPCATAERMPVSVVWDERVSPAIDCNPVRTQHTLVVTVLDQCGQPLPGQRVEWILARSRDAVGDIVGIDDQYADTSIAPLRNAQPGNGGNKIDNQFGVSITNWENETIDAANNYPFTSENGARMPDIRIGRGQSWITVTSVYEGVTDIIAYVPAIKDGTKHKIFAKKIWADYEVKFPESATNLLPASTHAFTVNVHKASDGTGLAGTTVEAEVLDGPEAAFDGGKLMTAVSGPDGNATFNLRNTGGMPGTNRLRFTAKGAFHGLECPRTEIATKTWRKVALECRCAVSAAEVNVGDPVDAVFTVTNTGDAPSGDLTLAVAPPPGLVVADGTQFPLSLGNAAPGATVQKSVRFTMSAEGVQQLTTTVTSAEGGGSSQCACQTTGVRGVLALECRCEPGTVDVGATISIVGTVSNTGKGSIRNVKVELAWPDGMTPQTQNVVTLPEMAPGRVDQFVFQGVPTRPGRYPTVVKASGDGFAEVTSGCECAAVQCALEISMIAPGKIGYGEPGNFTVKIVNKGDGAAMNCALRVTHGACLDGGVKDFPIGTVAPGETKTIDWVANGLANAKCNVVAEVTCAGCTQRAESEVDVQGLPALQCEMVDQTLQHVEAGIFKVGEEFLYVLDVQNDVATQATPPLKVVLSLPPELEFVSGTSDRGVSVAGAAQQATTTEFRLDINEKIRFEFRVKALKAPPGNLVKAMASVQRASDGAELADENESTTIK